MNTLEELISKNLDYYPELVEYRDVVIGFIKDYKTKRPDMCVEGCKSLIEGLCKLVYFNLNKDSANQKDWNDYKFTQKYKQTIEVLDLGGHEEEFVEKNGQLIHKLGEIRNERGDISHGQVYPKESYSDPDFAKFVSSWAESLCYFILTKYFSIKQEQKEKESIEIYTGEQFEEFDNYLDGLYQNIGFISYSKALKEQDPPQYELLMDAYFENDKQA